MNNYSTKNAVITANVSSYMTAGINDNVTLSNVKVDKSPNGNDFLEIEFEKDGKTVTMTVWQNKINSWIKTADDLQNQDNKQFGRILQILKCFYPEEELQLEVSSFIDMINWVKGKLDAVIITKKLLRLKVVYNTKGYTTTSNNGIFIEPMDAAESEVEKLPRDRFERPVIADKEEKVDPLAQAIETAPTTPTTENKADDLPF